MVQAPFFEGLHGSQRIPDGPVSTEGACTNINTQELTGHTVLLLEKYGAARRFGGPQFSFHVKQQLCRCTIERNTNLHFRFHFEPTDLPNLLFGDGCSGSFNVVPYEWLGKA